MQLNERKRALSSGESPAAKKTTSDPETETSTFAPKGQPQRVYLTTRELQGPQLKDPGMDLLAVYTTVEDANSSIKALAKAVAGFDDFSWSNGTGGNGELKLHGIDYTTGNSITFDVTILDVDPDKITMSFPEDFFRDPVKEDGKDDGGSRAGRDLELGKYDIG